MTQNKSDIRFNEIQLEFHPSKLTKCGEIRISDCCTNAYLFCAFCCNYDDDEAANNKFFTTLQDFVQHIRWHRSDDFEDSPVMQNGISYDGLDDDSQSDVLSAPQPIRETEFLTDWIAPPEELFESNIIGSFIEMETSEHHQNDAPVTKQQSQQIQAEEEMPELTGEVFLELVDVYKKCPCLWHERIAATTSPDTIDRVYKLMTLHFNRIAQQSKSEEFVRLILKQIKNCFLDEYKRVEGSNENPPWYFAYLSFILGCNSLELDKTIYADFKCSLCGSDHTSHEDLWNHISIIHLDLGTSPPVIDVATTIANTSVVVDHLTEPVLDISKTSVGECSAEVADKFNDLYRSQKCLWDKNNKEYDCCLVRQKSYDLLLNLLQEHDPNSTFDDVDRRISDLPDTFFTVNNDDKVDNNKGTMVENGFLDEVPPASNHVELQTENIITKENTPVRSPLPQLTAQPANYFKKITTGTCPLCSKSFNELSTWLSHLELAHTKEDLQSKDGFFYCTVCGWQNKTKKLLIRHLRYRHWNNMQACSDCNMTFRFLSMLVRHRAKVHNDVSPFKCDQCSEGFTSRSLLLLHAKTHKSPVKRSILCVQCGSEFVDWKSYTSHVSGHKLDKKECRLCQKKLSSLAELRKHMCTHVNLLQHKCDKCGRVFRSAKFLSKHLNSLHNHATNTNNPLSRNKIKRQKAAAIPTATNQCSQASCDVCGTKFFRKSSLLKHKRLKHKQISEES